MSTLRMSPEIQFDLTAFIISLFTSVSLIEPKHCVNGTLRRYQITSAALNLRWWLLSPTFVHRVKETFNVSTIQMYAHHYSLLAMGQVTEALYKLNEVVVVNQHSAFIDIALNHLARFVLMMDGKRHLSSLNLPPSGCWFWVFHSDKHLCVSCR